MEPEAIAFLKRVAKSIMAGFLWLAVNAIAAIWGDNAFIGDHILFSNVVFYIWFVISVFLLVYYLKGLWNLNPLPLLHAVEKGRLCRSFPGSGASISAPSHAPSYEKGRCCRSFPGISTSIINFLPKSYLSTSFSLPNF